MKTLAAVYAGFLVGVFATLWALDYRIVSWPGLVILGLTGASYIAAVAGVKMLQWANAMRKHLMREQYGRRP